MPDGLAIDRVLDELYVDGTIPGYQRAPKPPNDTPPAFGREDKSGWVWVEVCLHPKPRGNTFCVSVWSTGIETWCFWTELAESDDLDLADLLHLIDYVKDVYDSARSIAPIGRRSRPSALSS